MSKRLGRIIGCKYETLRGIETGSSMVVTLGQNYNVGEKPTVILLSLLLLLFLTFSVLVANPKKLLYTVANPARGLLNKEKRTEEKVWQHTPPPSPTLLVRRKKIKSSDASTGATQVSVGLASVQGYLGLVD